ncbi:MAG TPA: hypothetical protein PKC91_08990 [Ignavibacteria bacterium]|nr:hypothetical protein [Ignavibacteria bacterium]
MNENTLKDLWKSSNEKLEMSLSLGRKNAEDITQIKVQSFISSMKPVKLFTILAGLLWVGILGTAVLNLFIYAFPQVNQFFLFSAAIQVSLTAVSLIIYIYQLVLIYHVDISEPILETQAKLIKLKSSSLLVARILLLQLPVWTTFYWNESMFANGNIFLLIIQGIVTLTFTIAAGWLFFNIKIENKDKKWFRFLFSGSEWQPIISSMNIIKQLGEFKNG